MTMLQITAEALTLQDQREVPDRLCRQINYQQKRLARSTRRGRLKKRSTSIVARPAGPILGEPAGAKSLNRVIVEWKCGRRHAWVGGGGSGGGASGGGLGDYWACKSSCETAHSKCLDTCEGTWENPKPSRNCLICDENYQSCSRACSRNIA